MESIVKNKEYDILFSDMDDTLIAITDVSTIEIVEEHIKKIADIFNNLSSDNIIVIVSSLNHPLFPFEKAELLHKYLKKELKNNLFYFFSETSRYFADYKSNIYSIGNLKTFLIEEKEEAVNIVMDFLQKLGIKIKNIYGLGDGVADVDMLLKIKNLGGYVGIIEDQDMSNFHFPNLSEINENNIDEIINEMLGYENVIELGFVTKQIEKRKIEKKDNIPFLESPELLECAKEYKKKKMQIKADFLSGKITKDDLYKRTWIAYLTRHSIAFKSFKDENDNYDINKAKKYVDDVASLADNFSFSAIENLDLQLGEPIFLKKLMNSEKKA